MSITSALELHLCTHTREIRNETWMQHTGLDFTNTWHQLPFDSSLVHCCYTEAASVRQPGIETTSKKIRVNIIGSEITSVHTRVVHDDTCMRNTGIAFAKTWHKSLRGPSIFFASSGIFPCLLATHSLINPLKAQLCGNLKSKQLPQQYMSRTSAMKLHLCMNTHTHARHM